MLRDAPRASPPQRDLAATLEGLLAVAVAAVGADAGAIYLIHPPENDLRLEAARGLPVEVLGHRLALGEGLTGRVAAEGRSLVSADVQLDPRAIRRRPDWDLEPLMRAYLGVPLRAGSLVIGALELTGHAPELFDLADRGHVYTLADAAALLIEQTRLLVAPPPAAMEGAPLAGGDPVGVLTLNHRLQVTSANPAFARLSGQPVEGLVGRPVLAVLPGLGRPRARDALEAALHGSLGHVTGLRLGADRTVSVSFIPVGGLGEGIGGVLLAVQDVTERVRLEAELRAQHQRAMEATERLRSVVEVVTHELRTPLTSVLGYARLLHDRPEAAEAKRRYWADLVTEKARLMARLVDEITALARMGSARFSLDQAPVDLGSLVRDLAQAFEPDAEGHTIEVTVEQNLPPVSLDRDRIGQVIENLLTNAAKYWPGPGAIQVRVVSEPPASLRVEVTDRGPGIPADLAERAFEPFIRGQDEATHVVPGTGLGLAVARGIVEAHGGRIWLAPVTGGGTTVAFSLPVAAAGTPVDDP